MIISIIAPPSNAPQVHVAAPPASDPQTFLDPVEDRIVRTARDMEPVHVWKLLNRLVDEEALPNRLEMRRRKVELWRLVNSLLRRRMLVRAGRHGVATIKPSPPAPRVKQPGRKREKTSTVVHCASDPAGSAARGTKSSVGGSLAEKPEMQVIKARRETDSATTAAKSAAPLSQEERVNAARALANLRWQRKPKRWSGWLPDGTRVWRGRRVMVDGQVWYAYGCLRSKLVISLDDGKLLGWPGEDDLRWRVVPAHTASVWRDPNARLLGSLKRGVRERSSSAKRLSARQNGSMRRGTVND